ncbi:amino acid adenylation domain-containing protein, partial [Curtanaerobium respiraculi]|uniref:amino acid adenylation domain-containing protein n=1 Tax=Curtanaerobium respiraculi TaxID=2949669 RepID=UPI0024B33AD2
LLPSYERASRGDARPAAPGPIHAGFFERAAEDPGRIALRWGESGSMTYGELDRAARSVAAWLARRGVGPGGRVALRLPKGPQQAVACLGVAASGASYVPIGASQPDLRAASIIEQAACAAVVGPDEVRRALACPPLASPAAPPADAEAYVIFTSGSTGAPKGVSMSHGAARNTLRDVVERFGVGGDDRVFAVSALDFDLSVFDLFGVLGAGGSLVIPTERQRRDASEWAGLCERHRVTLWNSAPALLDVLADSYPRALSSMRLALVSGDWVPLGLRGKLPARVRLVALGGATEAGIWSNFHEVSEVDPLWRSIPYGRPLSNQSFRVVGADGLDCPDWVAGELLIGGASLASGYVADPERTRASFPVDSRGRWYRTGDEGRFWPDGTIEFLGRRQSQQQVKVRGHRVELGEIEAA